MPTNHQSSSCWLAVAASVGSPLLRRSAEPAGAHCIMQTNWLVCERALHYFVRPTSACCRLFNAATIGAAAPGALQIIARSTQTLEPTRPDGNPASSSKQTARPTRVHQAACIDGTSSSTGRPSRAGCFQLASAGVRFGVASTQSDVAAGSAGAPPVGGLGPEVANEVPAHNVHVGLRE